MFEVTNHREASSNWVWMGFSASFLVWAWSLSGEMMFLPLSQDGDIVVVVVAGPNGEVGQGMEVILC